jgi:hypothetical protein
MTPALFTRTSAPPELVLDALAGGDERVAVGDVGRDRDGCLAELFGERANAVRATCEERDAVAGCGQCAGGGFADA